MKKDQAGLYIHIPFCLRKCGYCSFYSVDSVNLIPQFISALKKEIKHYHEIFPSFDTIYFGGGTPSLLTSEQLIDIFIFINKYINIKTNAEITLESNPGDISFKYLNVLHNIGINRLNIGIQSFDDKILRFLGRRHSVHEAISSIEAARQAGFNNLGIDLIYGVHGLSTKSWLNTLHQAISFAPEHISCYELSLNERTPLYKKYLANGWHLLDEKKDLKMFLTTAETLENAGYIHYEVSNFALKDKFKSCHNQKYWRHTPYLGVGPAAHSFLNNKRWWNKAKVKTYLKDIDRGKVPIEASEILSIEQLQMEALFIGLRTQAGVDLKRYKTRFGIDLLEQKKIIIEALIKNKLLVIKNGFLRPTPAGMAVADSLALI